jgi:heavy metal-binding protein
MTLRQVIALAGSLALAACSPGPAPVSSSPRDPSNPNAPEGASPLPTAPPASEAPAGDPAHQHGHAHGAPSGAAPGGGASSLGGQAVAYTCPMHPEVVSPTPGQCPKCGMNLVPKK